MMIRRLLIGWNCLLAVVSLAAQQVDLRNSPIAKAMDSEDTVVYALLNTNITDPPQEPVRAMAEWEELQAIALAWSSQWTDVSRFDLLAEIVRHAKEEVNVIIICDLPSKVQAQLSERGVHDHSNIFFEGVGIHFNRIWIRDFGAHTLYENEVDSMLLVDWMYDQDYPVADTASPAAVAQHYDLPLYSTNSNRYAFRLDGGNFLADGLGTAFSSDRVLLENGQLAFVKSIAEDFMGIDNYVVLPRLPYDVIHHVDMHMKLLDEETLLIGEYPEGEGDYAQLEANVEYIRQTIRTPFGTPYNIVRIPMPPDRFGGYPDDANLCSKRGMGCYRTYTNALFVNNTVLVPTYETAYDTTALRIWRKLMPGYNIVGINCEELIDEYGAIHCITKEIGVPDPLWIVHQKIQSACSNENYTVQATIKHRSGVAQAAVFYTTDLEAGYEKIPMEHLRDGSWQAEIPAQSPDAKVYYYIAAKANSGKKINRPLPAPEAYWTFEVENCLTTNVTSHENDVRLQVFPNPTTGDTFLTLQLQEPAVGAIMISNLLGQPLQTLQSTRRFAPQDHTFRISTRNYEPGIYIVKFQTERGQFSRPFIIQK